MEKFVFLTDQKFFHSKKYALGFNIKALFLGPFYLLMEEDWVGFIIALIITVSSLGIFWLIYPFFCNRAKVSRLLARGYEPSRFEDKILINQLKLRPKAINKEIYVARICTADDLFFG